MLIIENNVKVKIAVVVNGKEGKLTNHTSLDINDCN